MLEYIDAMGALNLSGADILVQCKSGKMQEAAYLPETYSRLQVSAIA